MDILVATSYLQARQKVLKVGEAIVLELKKGWGPRSQLDVLSQDPDYSAYHVQGDRGIDFSQY